MSYLPLGKPYCKQMFVMMKTEYIRCLQERLKSAFAARDREMKQKKSLDRVKDRTPSDRAQIVSSLNMLINN